MTEYDDDLDAILARVEPDTRKIIETQRNMQRDMMRLYLRIRQAQTLLWWMTAGNVSIMLLTAFLLGWAGRL